MSISFSQAKMAPLHSYGAVKTLVLEKLGRQWESAQAYQETCSLINWSVKWFMLNSFFGPFHVICAYTCRISHGWGFYQRSSCTYATFGEFWGYTLMQRGKYTNTFIAMFPIDFSLLGMDEDETHMLREKQKGQPASCLNNPINLLQLFFEQ